MFCGNCGAENRSSGKFCQQCGSPLTRSCPSCGAPAAAGATFCDECGQRLDSAATAAPVSIPAATPAATAAPATERRLVSILFADLVGFTTASENRDAEDVRELLNRYFETCSQLIGRYGGTVEKFIGDAVMAVWGTPVANEDDAERAVRAALDLTTAVAALGAEAGLAGLQARAAVLTGEAAVAVRAVGQGMVAGDLVNTASRVQALAAPGSVYVDAPTRRTSEAAVVYESAGRHEIRGKKAPIDLWRALRVAGGIKGALKSDGLEAPFVGRDRELRLIKELFHASADERTARVASVIGIGGIGKSRLAWEFYKYIDGLATVTFWHRGRCPAYGDGVTYWALAEMVRMRCGIGEDEAAEPSLAKLRATLEVRVDDAEERRWLEPRLAHLLGLGERTDWEGSDLFGAWRRFFERLAEAAPAVLVFEDMQWADAALVEFVEHLLDWSRSYPLFVLTLARPELAQRHPGWEAGKRNFTSLNLEPLAPDAMEALLTGFVPGLPDELMRQLLERSEGVPLYAVETVRMLLDRGLLTREEGRYRVSGPVGALDVPESLHALIASRLDALSADERAIVQYASVLGKTFTVDAIDALAPEARDVRGLLESLVRKEIFGIQADPRSPERGQFGFLQDLVRKVAYETISRRERKLLHLRAAEQLEVRSGAESPDLAQVVASHYLDAIAAQPDADDAPEIRTRAVDALTRAGERAAALVASADAMRYFDQAAGLAEDPIQRARLLNRAAHMAFNQSLSVAATERFREALTLFEAHGAVHDAAKVSADLGQLLWRSGDSDAAVVQVERALSVLATDDTDPDVAVLAAQIAKLHFFRGEGDLARERIELALRNAEFLALPAVLSDALNTKGIMVAQLDGLMQEGLALLKHALDIALEHDLVEGTLRAHVNLSWIYEAADRRDLSEQHCRAALGIAQNYGVRGWEQMALSNLTGLLYEAGRWDEAIATWAEVPPDGLSYKAGIIAIARILVARGKVAEARRQYAPIQASYKDSVDFQEREIMLQTDSILLRAEGRCEEALVSAEQLLTGAGTERLRGQAALDTFLEAGECYLCLGRLDSLRELLDTADRLHPGMVSKLARAHIDRFRGRVAAAAGGGDAVEHYRAGAAAFGALGHPFLQAVTLVELAEALCADGRRDEAGEPALSASAILEPLGAAPWLERVRPLTGSAAPA